MDASFVKEQLELLDGDLKVLFKGAYALVQCPFHKQGQEIHPSMMVNIDDSRYSVGFCFCMSCGEKGDWNKIAAALGMEEVTKEGNHINKLTIKKVPLLTPTLPKKNSFEAPWLAKNDWRGINGALLADLKARSSFNTSTKEKQLILPVIIGRNEVGQINCSLNKKPKEVGPSYMNSPGPWVKKALFPFDYTLELANRKKAPVFIVEGPRDALNLIQKGIPSLAILGTQNWSKACTTLLTLFQRAEYIIFMDGDDAGDAATETLYKDLIKVFDKAQVSVCPLPRGKDPADLDANMSCLLKNSYSIN